jgi:hypothetical protein
MGGVTILAAAKFDRTKGMLHASGRLAMMMMSS